MNPAVAGDWKRAKESLGAAWSCHRDGYHADSVARAYYATLHAAKAALELQGVSAERHTDVTRMFRLYLVNVGLVEERWLDIFAVGSDERMHSDYDVMTVFDDQDSVEACQRSEAFLNRIRLLLGGSVAQEGSEGG